MSECKKTKFNYRVVNIDRFGTQVLAVSVGTIDETELLILYNSFNKVVDIGGNGDYPISFGANSSSCPTCDIFQHPSQFGLGVSSFTTLKGLPIVLLTKLCLMTFFNWYYIYLEYFFGI